MLAGGLSLEVTGAPASRRTSEAPSPPWTIARGERIAVLGGNGAGKSTLLRTLAGIEPARRTAVRVNGVPFSALDGAARARAVAWLPQEEPAPEGLSVRSAVALGRAPHRPPSLRDDPRDDAPIEALLARFGLVSLAARPMNTLSGGERKRVALARLFAQEAPVVLLDEPFAPLDAGMTLRIASILLEEAAHGVAFVVALHDPNLALELATRILLIEDGRVVADGPTDEILNDDALLRIHGGGWAPARRADDDARRWVPAAVKRPGSSESTTW